MSAVRDYIDASVQVVLVRYADVLDDTTRTIVELAFREGVTHGLKLSEIISGGENSEHQRTN